MTKVGLDFGETIEGRFYPAGCVIDIFDHEAAELVQAERAHYVADGTMARLKAYGVPGCFPPANFEAAKTEQQTNTKKK